MCVHGCTYILTCEHTSAHVCSCLHVLRSEVNTGCLLQCFFILFFETRSLTEPELTNWVRLAQQGPGICLLHPFLHRAVAVHHSAEVFLSSEDSDSGPHACMASALPTKPSQEPQHATFCVLSLSYQTSTQHTDSSASLEISI